ncbi:MAG: competence/damage-inducible protein A [Phycisphaerae bacterium]|nr:competence/damage-inducible protein A [Phycisphaerae bacterium]
MATEHRTAAILAVGDEIVLGQSLDTNSRWLSQRLFDLGIVPVEHATVGDDLGAHAAAFRRLAERADMVVCTGGLGPTADDLTRAALAGASGDTLVEDAGALASIEAFLKERGRAMSPLNRTQARRPSRAAWLPNGHGTAPGLAGEVGACDVFCIPGPPAEMRPMFEGHVRPRLKPPTDRAVRTRALHCVGLGESDLADRLGSLMSRDRNPTVGTTASGGVVSVRLRSVAPGEAEAERLLDADEHEVRRLAGPHLFGADGETIAGAVVGRLVARGRGLVVAESCTGGMLGAMVTQVPGSSAVFRGGWIVYDNRAKVADLGVPGALLGAGGPGAVSREVAAAMAEGALRHGRDRDADTALAITGIAGPEGGSPDKPVGTVFVALARADAATDVRRFSMAGDRESVRRWSALSALAMLWMHLAGAPATRLLREIEATTGVSGTGA